MALYVKVFNNFYTNKKTVRLKSMIGEAALWVPPRLWAYAAENQSNGCFSGYSAQEIADHIHYTGDASSMLQALLQAGFLDTDTMTIHGWEEHNSYHATYSARASKGGKALAEKRKNSAPTSNERGDDKRERGDKQCFKHAPSTIGEGVQEASLYAEWPTREEWDWACKQFDLPEWKIKDEWLKQESARPKWGKVGDYKAYAERVAAWWVADGKPMAPVGSKAGFPSTLSQQIAATQKLLTAATEKIRRQPRPNKSLLTDDEYNAETKALNEMVEEKSKLAERLKELNQQQSEGGRL